MPYVINWDNPNITAPLVEAAHLAMERKSDLDLNSFVLGYKLAFELVLIPAREERSRRSRTTP